MLIINTDGDEHKSDNSIWLGLLHSVHCLQFLAPICPILHQMSQLDSPWRPVDRTSFMNTLKVGHQSPIIVQHMKKSLPKSDKDPFKRGTFLLKAMQTICFLFIFISIYSITTKRICNIQCLLQQALFSDALQPIGLSLLTDLWHTGPTGANADVTGRGERNQGHEDQPANLLNILMIYQLDMRIMHKEVHIFGWKYMMLKANMYSPHANMRSYKCNLTNQHFCELFQSSLQTNSTKQNPVCSLNLKISQLGSISSIFPSHPPAIPRYWYWYWYWYCQVARYWYFTTIQNYPKMKKVVKLKLDIANWIAGLSWSKSSFHQLCFLILLWTDLFTKAQPHTRPLTSLTLAATIANANEPH